MKKLIIVFMFAALWAGAANAAVVSLNFENWGGAPTGASPTAGVVDVSYWNDTWIDAGKVSPMLDLRDSTGAATTVDVAWASGGEWGVNLWNDTGADDDGRLNVSVMKGFIDSNQNQAITQSSFTVSEIAYDLYDLYVYVMSDTQDRTGTVTDGTTTYHFLTDPESLHFSGDPLSADYVDFKQITALDAGSAVNGNYAVFSGLSGATQTITTDVLGGGGIAAFQIVEIPEPATLVLLSLGGLLLRRKK